MIIVVLTRHKLKTSFIVLDDDHCYTTVEEPNETDENVFKPPEIDLPEDEPIKSTPSSKGPVKEQENPYVTLPEMEILSDSTYSLRMSRNMDSNFQPTGDLYDALDQSR